MINKINNNSIASLLQNTQKQTQSAEQSADVSLAQNTGEQSPWHVIANKYNVNNLSQEKFTQLSNDLYNAGLVSFKEYALMSFDNEQAIQDLQNQGVLGQGARTTMTHPDASGNYNWLQEYNDRVAFDQLRGNTQSMQNNQRILSVLQKLEAAANTQPVNTLV